MRANVLLTITLSLALTVPLAASVQNGAETDEDAEIVLPKIGADTPLVVDESGDRMTGDLEFARGMGIAFTGGRLTGEDLPRWNGIALCAASIPTPGCAAAANIVGIDTGFGLDGGGTSGTVTIAADPAVLQARVGSECALGSSIRAIGQNGAVSCWTDQNSGGTVRSVASGSGLTGGTITSTGTIGLNVDGIAACTATSHKILWSSALARLACAADLDTTYAAGSGLALAGTTFSVDRASVQSRVTGSCPAGAPIQAIAQEGGVSCDASLAGRVADVESFVNNGSLVGSSLSLSGAASWVGDLAGGNVPWSRLNAFPGACPSGQFAVAVGATLACATPASTAYAAGDGLDLAGTTFSLDASGIGTCTTEANTLLWDATNGRLACGGDANSGGTVTSVASGTGLAGGPVTTSGALALDTAAIGTCGSATQKVLWDASNGRLTCGTDANSGGTVTSVASGTGLAGGPVTGSGTLSLNTAAIGTCTGAGQKILWDAANGRLTCGNDANSGGTVTSVASGAGLTGGPITGSGTLAIATGGVTSGMLQDGGVATADIAGGAVTSAKIDPTTVQQRVSGTCANGNAVSAVHQAGSVGCQTVWARNGNAGTNPPFDFLGTTDAKPLEIRVNNTRAWRVEPATVPNLLAWGNGASGNVVTPGVRGGTISGGGDLSYGRNIVSDDMSTVGGGEANQAGDTAGSTTDARWATVAGGRGNIAATTATAIGGGTDNIATGGASAIGGGYGNLAAGYAAVVAGGSGNVAQATLSTVGGGSSNDATGHSSVVAGGYGNTASGADATVAGGEQNTASGEWASVGGGLRNRATERFSTAAGGYDNKADAWGATVGGGNNNNVTSTYGTVPGGRENEAGQNAFAAGTRAKALNPGSFVWADLTLANFSSTGGNQFLVRAGGGAAINTNYPISGADLTLNRTLVVDAGNGNAGTLANGVTFGRGSGEGIGSKRTSGGNQWGLDFYTNFANRLSIRNNGWVGIGTTDPQDQLDVKGDLRVGFGTTGCVRDTDGTVIAGTCASDARFKKDVRPFGRLLDRLVQLEPVHYKWRADEFPHKRFGQNETWGLIAQDTKAVMPEIVEQDAEGYLAVRYGDLPILLLQGVKELEERNRALEERNDQLEARLAALEAAIAAGASR